MNLRWFRVGFGINALTGLNGFKVIGENKIIQHDIHSSESRRVYHDSRLLEARWNFANLKGNVEMIRLP